MLELLRRLAPAPGRAAALRSEGDECSDRYRDGDSETKTSRIPEDARIVRSPGVGGEEERRWSEGAMMQARQDDVASAQGRAHERRLRPTPPQPLREQGEGGTGDTVSLLREQGHQHDSTALRHRAHVPGPNSAFNSTAKEAGVGPRPRSPASSFGEKSSAHGSPPRLDQQVEARCFRPGLVLLCFLIGLAGGMLAPDEHPLGVFLASISIPLGSHARERPFGAAPMSHGAMKGLSFLADEGRQFVAVIPASTGTPSPEEVALRALGPADLGHCEGYHRMDVATLNPAPEGIRPLMIVVTPTYVRPFQAMFLRRMANLLRRVPPPLLWIVVEIGQQTAETALLLRQTGLVYRHIVTRKEMRDIKDRGVNQRNAALEHIEEHRLNGIVYFADDDNIFSPAIFHEMRTIRRFGTWPVAMLQQGKGRAIIEGPVCDGRHVIGWHTNEKSKRVRRFHVDMSGFAFNSTILWNPLAWGRPTNASIRQLDTVKEGFQETTFIEQLVPDESEMEGLANGCTDVLVWHVHSEALRKSPFPHWTSPPKLEAVIPARKAGTAHAT